MLTKENIKKVKGYVYDFEWKGNKFDLENQLILQNKLNGLQNTIDAIGFFSLAQMIILLTYIVTKLS